MQQLMQHRDLETIRLYVNRADRLNRTADRIFVPEVARRVARG